METEEALPEGADAVVDAALEDASLAFDGAVFVGHGRWHEQCAPCGWRKAPRREPAAAASRARMRVVAASSIGCLQFGAESVEDVGALVVGESLEGFGGEVTEEGDGFERVK
jgi:hypothetical protein